MSPLLGTNHVAEDDSFLVTNNEIKSLTPVATLTMVASASLPHTANDPSASQRRLRRQAQ